MKAYFIAAAALCLASAHLSAQDAAPLASDMSSQTTLTLTADSAVELALQNHIDVQTQAIQTEQARREYAHAWNNVLPSISASGTGSKSRSYEDAEADTLSVQAGISASISLDTGLSAKIKALKASYEAGEATYADTVRATETAVRTSFYNLLYLKEKLVAAQTTLESYQRQYDQTEAKAKRGMASELDLLTAQVNLETAKPDVDNAENTYLNALVSFLNTIGVSFAPNMDIALSGSLDYAEQVQLADTDELINTCIEKSSEVRALEDKIRTAEYSRTATANSLYFPTLKASAAAYPLNWQNESLSDTSTQTPNWSVSLGLTLPLDSWLPGSSARDSISALDDTIATYKLQLEDKKKSVRTDVIEKLKSIELSQKTLKARKMNLALAKRSYQMTEDAFNRGTKDLLSLQNALDTLQNAELQLRSEQYTLISNVLSLENTLSLPAGSLFSENAAENATNK